MPRHAGVSAEAQSGSSMWCLMVASLLLTLPQTARSQAPAEVRAVVGHDVTLPCHVKPAGDTGGEMEVEWSKSDLDPRLVHVRRSAVDHVVDQNTAYKNRTWLSTEGLKQGDASLRLSKVRLADQGRYTCLVPGLETQSSLQLVVDAVIEVSRVSGGVLHCESEGWFPAPEVRWLDGEGKLLTAGPPETFRGPEDLYAVSSRLTVEEGHSKTFTCRVQTKQDQFREIQVLVPDDFFTPSSAGSTIMWASLGVILLLVLVLVGLKRRQDKINTKNQPEDEEAPKLKDEWIRSTCEDPERLCLLEAGTDLVMQEAVQEEEEGKRSSKEETELCGPFVSETEANSVQVHSHDKVEQRFELEKDNQDQDGDDENKAEGEAQQDDTAELSVEVRQKMERTGGDQEQTPPNLDHAGPPASSDRPTEQGEEPKGQPAQQPLAQEAGFLDTQQEQDQQNQDQRDQENQDQRDQGTQEQRDQENQDQKDQEKKDQRDQESQERGNQDQRDQESQERGNQDQRDQENQDQKDQEKKDQSDQESQDHKNQQDQTQTAGQAKKRRKRNRGGKNKKS